MSGQLRVRPEAEQDVREACAWYDEHQPGLAERFLMSLEAAFAAVQRNPASNRTVLRDVRRVLLRRFPFCVFYRETPGEVTVVAVLHAARDPRTWRSRS
jgi:toxin ParE1/3/4